MKKTIYFLKVLKSFRPSQRPEIDAREIPQFLKTSWFPFPWQIPFLSGYLVAYRNVEANVTLQLSQWVEGGGCQQNAIHRKLDGRTSDSHLNGQISCNLHPLGAPPPTSLVHISMKILQAFGNAERRHFDGRKVQNAKRLSIFRIRNKYQWPRWNPCFRPEKGRVKRKLSYDEAQPPNSNINSPTGENRSEKMMVKIIP